MFIHHGFQFIGIDGLRPFTDQIIEFFLYGTPRSMRCVALVQSEFRTAHRLSESLARSRNHLVLDLNKLHWDQVTDLEPLRKTLADYRSRISVVLPTHSKL